jgi:hypothetical protein
VGTARWRSKRGEAEAEAEQRQREERSGQVESVFVERKVDTRRSKHAKRKIFSSLHCWPQFLVMVAFT